MIKYSLTLLSCLAILFSVQASLSSEEERILSAIARIDDEFRTSRRRTQQRSSRGSRERERNNRQQTLNRSKKSPSILALQNRTKLESSKAESTISKTTTATSTLTSRPPRRHMNPSQPSAPKAASTATLPWVSKFLNERSKDVLLPVPREYIADGFNLA